MFSRIYSQSDEKKFKNRYKKNSFWERLAGNRLKTHLKIIVAELMNKFNSNILEGKGLLKKLGVKAIWIIDSSTITLQDNAKKRFPGTGAKAGIKWHACFNALSGVMEWFRLTPSSTNDRKCFPNVALLENKLIISDLGYFDYSLLLSIKDIGGFFLSRLKSNSVVYVTKGVLGFPKKVVGKSLLSIRFKGEKEAVVEALIKKVCGKKILECRAVGFWNPLEKKYHWYLTNLVVAAHIIYPLYRVRWQIELIFKACKSSLNANQIPSANENIIESLLLASIASYLSTYTLLDNALPYLDNQQKQAISFQRIGKTASLLAQYFIDFLLSSSKESLDNLLKQIKLFSNEIFDPNYKRRKTSMGTMYDLLGEGM